MSFDDGQHIRFEDGPAFEQGLDWPGHEKVWGRLVLPSRRFPQFCFEFARAQAKHSMGWGDYRGG